MDKMTVRSTHLWVSSAIIIPRMDKRSTRDVVIANIETLMERAGDSQRSLARKLGWSQSTINNMLSGDHGLSLEKVDEIARVYGFDGWHLLLRDLPRDLDESKSISRLFNCYTTSNAEGKDYISRVAEKEARYGEK